MEKKTGSFTVKERNREVPYFLYLPSSPPKGIVQIVHGMCECIERYEEMGTVGALAEGGYIVCGCDLPGHGVRVTDGNYGDFDSYLTLEEDVLGLQAELRKKYRFLPYFYLAHSLGSFLMRDILGGGFAETAGVILSGTCGTDEPAAAGILASYLPLFWQKKPCDLLRGIVYKRYAKLIGQTDPAAWITKDPSVVERYKNDPRTNFAFSARAWREVFRLTKAISGTGSLEYLPHSVPIYLISGECDPVGECGSGVKLLYDALFEEGVDDLTVKLYPDARHEILNDFCKEEVRADILAWLDTECSNRVLVNSWR